MKINFSHDYGLPCVCLASDELPTAAELIQACENAGAVGKTQEGKNGQIKTMFYIVQFPGQPCESETEITLKRKCRE